MFSVPKTQARPGDVDLWQWLDEGQKVEATTLMSLFYYALSPSTDEVLCFLDHSTLKEIRVYSEDKLAWFIPSPTETLENLARFAVAFEALAARGKLRFG